MDQLEVRRLFLRAIEVPPDARVALLDSAGCSSDTREAVWTLLRNDRGAETLIDRAVARERDSAVAADAFNSSQIRQVIGSGIQKSKPPEEHAPARIGKYEVQGELGRGGFGRVYRAYDPSVGRPVAIKVLASDGDPDLLARFRAEAGMTGKLQHKNIVTVFDCGEQDGSPYLVTEYLEGENLLSVLRSQRTLGLLDKMRILGQIAEGLHHAHMAGVIHRDIKPANIMLLPSGAVKIMDFGIARLAGMAPTRRMRSGDPIGTASYLSPEQFRGGEADARSDIFSLGLIGYELLSGVHPFQAADASATIYRIMSADPAPLRQVFPECSEPLEALVHRMLARDPDRRYASLDDVLIDAEPIVLELRRDHSNQLMVEVNDLIARNEFEKAQAKLKQALELDPLNREARRVKGTIQEERNRRLIEENIKSLERDATDQIGKRAFADALQSLENALRLSPNDARLKALVDDAHAKLAASREAVRLLAEAKHEAQGERFRQAKDLVLQAVAADPEHPEAPPLLQHLDDEIGRLEKAQGLEAGIDEAERLLQAGEYDRALERLQALHRDYPGKPQIADLESRIQARQMDDYRRKRAAWLESELSKARQLQADGAFPQALQVLDALLADFANFPALRQLRAAIQEEIAAVERAAGLGTLLQNARDLIWKRQLPEAIAVLESGAKSYPGDAGVLYLFKAAQALQMDESRQRSLAEIASQARALRKQNRLDEALELLKTGLKTHGSDTVLTDLGRIATLEQESRRGFDKLQGYRAKAADLLAAGSISEALALLREARGWFPLDPMLELHEAEAEERYAQGNEQELVGAALRSVAEREKKGDLAGALEDVAMVLHRVPGSKELQAASANLTAKLLAVEREKRIQKLAQDVRRAMDNGEWTKAVESAAAARREFPDQIVFDELAGQIPARQRQAEVEKAVGGVREHLKQGDLESAAILLAQLEPRYGSEESWKAEKRNLERRHEPIERLRKAADLVKSGNSRDAEPLLRRLAEEDPGNEQVAALLRQIQPPKLPLDVSAKRRSFEEELFPAAKPARACARCKVQLPDGARFCDTCGNPV